MRAIVLFAVILAFPSTASARLRVVTTIQDLAALASEVGGGDIDVDSIAKGSQDPHFIEAKPSYMLKVSKADLLLAVGMGMEAGWLPPLLKGARNAKIAKGEKGLLELGPLLEPIEVATEKMTRAEGDVHPEGNPHFWLDPIRLGKAASLVADRLAELDPERKEQYRQRADAFAGRMKAKTEDWRKRIEKSGVKKVVSYHKALSYFCARFGLEAVAFLEPKPGIPPTSSHLIEVIRIMKAQRVPLILVENYFDVSVTKKITGEVPGSRAVSVAVSVGGTDKVKSADDLFEQLVAAVEGK